MATTWSLPAALSPPLDGRDAVADAIYRVVLGLDTNDLALFESALTEDAIFKINDYTMEGLPAIRSGCYDNIAKLDTTHFISNVRVNIAEGGSTASLSASALAQHYRAGTGNEGNAARLLAGALYLVDLVKEEPAGLWKIKSWKMRTNWMEGDKSLVGA
ncbi:hypothetical protein NKR23_g6521 [Pleurostoma richardsiae]|uniref:SnoaL-like domain-containing protein n=1 Tax=Pleurostoma richardsiae TaxID=41990 RepID=A0AA38VSA6_9PEZI|nr:hypothetical protein NKR23_g6521 [Pleurostoma richardsiae]